MEIGKHRELNQRIVVTHQATQRPGVHIIVYSGTLARGVLHGSPSAKCVTERAIQSFHLVQSLPLILHTTCVLVCEAALLYILVVCVSVCVYERSEGVNTHTPHMGF